MTEADHLTILDYAIDPGESSWIVSGPAPGLEVRTIPSPLVDPEFLLQLAELRDWACRPVRLGDPQAQGTEEYLQRLALRVSGRLEEVLFPDAVRRTVLPTIHTGGARLTLRVKRGGALGERVLALPWELARLPGRSFEVVREALIEGAPELPDPSEPLAVAALIAAPEDLSPIDYEEESLRLQSALASLGHQVFFADLGQVQDLVERVDADEPHVLHFSGYGREGCLLFENELGLADAVAVEELGRRLGIVLLNPRRRGTFPKLFFLSSRGHAVAGPGPEPPDLEAGPITAARLHRGGFAVVVGYFGPEDAELASRAEEAFYAALARGATGLQAAAKARATLERPLGEPGGERWYPLGRTLLAVYQRGSDRPLATGRATPAKGSSDRRRKVEVSGLPVLERGFIGRRGLQHEILRKIHAGAHLLVLQGLGGLGKTALAGQLVSRVLAPDDPADRLILRCQELSQFDDPILELWAQAEEHGFLHDLPGWRWRAGSLRATVAGAVGGLAATLQEIRHDRPNLVVYIDNAETLQVGPTEPSQGLGSWRPGAEEWWLQMEQLACQGLEILVSTRYAWDGLSPQAHLGVGPMSEADICRLIGSFDELSQLPWEARRELARRLGGHPRAVELLDRLVGLRSRELTWDELIGSILPEGEELLREDLLLEDLWRRLTEQAREHARYLGVLRRPAPAWVVDRLGTARDELIRASLLSRYREPVRMAQGVRWVDRWGLHDVVRGLATAGPGEKEREAFHRRAGEAWAEWLQQSGWLRPDQREAVFHLHAVRDADFAWPIAQDHSHWLRVQGRYQEARTLLEESIAAGASGRARVLAQIMLANVRTVQEEPGPGIEALYGEVLASEMSPDLRSEALHEHAAYLDLAGRPAEAEEAIRYALALKETCPGMPRHEIGISRLLLGRVLETCGRYEEAEKEIRKGLAILADAPEELRPQISVGYHSLARVLDKRGLREEAESLFREAAELDRPPAGEDDPQYAVALQSLGWILAQRGKAEEAEGWLRKALAMQERTFGREHPETATTRLTLARVLARQERNREAEELFREVIEIDRRTLPEGHPDRGHSLNALGSFLCKEARYTEAEPLLREALDLQEGLGGDTAILVSPLTNLAAVLLEQDRAAEAEPLLERALRLAREAQGPDGPDVGRVLPWLVRARSRLGKPPADARDSSDG